LAPCPNHYDGRLATMPSADFYLITARVAPRSAIGLHQIRSLWLMQTKEPRHLLTRALLVIYRSPVKQISPDKSMNFPCATASFTVAVRSHGFVVLYPKGINANSPPAYASYDVLVHQLAVLRPASSRPNLAVKPLPFASSYHLITT